MSDNRIHKTTNYDLFEQSGDNRPLDLDRHRRLVESMRRYGFIKSLHIICHRNPKVPAGGRGSLIIKAGQHRFAVAKELNLEVWYTVEEVDFDVAEDAATTVKWSLRDYALKWASKGLNDYLKGLEFAERHQMPIGFAFSLLAATTSFGNVKNGFLDGTYRVIDCEWAEQVARLYTGLVSLAPRLKNARLMEACMAVCRVPGFEPKRLLGGAERCRDKLIPYATRDSCLDMLEELYNAHRKQLVGLKVAALMAMRDRNPAGGSKAS